MAYVFHIVQKKRKKTQICGFSSASNSKVAGDVKKAPSCEDPEDRHNGKKQKTGELPYINLHIHDDN